MSAVIFLNDALWPTAIVCKVSDLFAKLVKHLNRPAMLSLSTYKAGMARGLTNRENLLTDVNSS